jgi:hypothetical protein
MSIDPSRRRAMGRPGRSRTVGRYVAAAEAAAAAVAATAANVAAATASALGKSGMRNHQENGECSKKLMHCSSASDDGKDGAGVADCRLLIAN